MLLLTENNLLLCLTDSVLSTHSLNGSNFPLIKTFEQTKGASSFALDNKVRTTIYKIYNTTTIQLTKTRDVLIPSLYLPHKVNSLTGYLLNTGIYLI